MYSEVPVYSFYHLASIGFQLQMFRFCNFGCNFNHLILLAVIFSFVIITLLFYFFNVEKCEIIEIVLFDIRKDILLKNENLAKLIIDCR